MNWDILDFAVFFGLIAMVVIAFRLAMRVSADKSYRIGIGVALLAGFILVWANGAVGIVGSENNDVNLLYFGVIAVGIIGALLARFRARGMAIALVATAIAQAAVACVALVAGWGVSGPIWPVDVLVLTAFFVGLWLTAAALFRHAARQLPSH